MRSSRPENLSSTRLTWRSLPTALASLGNARHSRHLDADRAAVLGLFHDASEIITGDMPTPVKYHDAAINEAYKAVEAGAEARLLATLPEDGGTSGETYFAGDGHGGSGAAADGDERTCGAWSRPRTASLPHQARGREAQRKRGVCQRRGHLPGGRGGRGGRASEVTDFVEEFLPSFGSTLDQLDR